MRPPSIVDVKEMVRKGQYANALRFLRSPSLSGVSATADRDILLAELFQRTGEGDRAAEIAQALLKDASTAPAVRSRCHIVLASAYRDAGRLTEAVEQFQRAIALAAVSGDHSLKCWAELRLLPACAENAGPDVAIGLLSKIRRDITQLADPMASAALHIFVAEIETKRGLYDSVNRHLRISTSLFEKEANLWLEGLAAIAKLCVLYLQSDLPEAERCARVALRAAESSGHAVTRMAAMSNLGHICLSKGKLEEAETWMEEASSCWRQGGGAGIAILDGLAQVALAKGDLERCEGLLRQTDALTKSSADSPSYYEACTFLTQTRLLLRRHCWDDAEQFASKAVQATHRKSLPILTAHLRLLKAEAAAMLGRLDEAANLIYHAASGHDEPSVELLAEIARVTGVAAARSGNPDAAAIHFDRAARILATVGNLCARNQVLEACADAVGRPLPAIFPQTPVRDSEVGTGDPADATRRAGTTPAVEPVPEYGPAGTVERAAAMLDFAGYPELLGHELLGLVRETGCATEAVLVAGPPARRDVLEQSGCGPERAAALAAARRPPFRLPLGTWHSRPIDLVAVPAADVASRATLIAIEKIVRSALWMQKARRDERERAALWPIDAPGEDGQEVFAGEGMSVVLTTARRIAPTNIPILVTGETGTGKEVVARLIHRTSNRADKPFVPFNCVAFPRDVLDSQLFGYRRGAFTGATADSPGVIRAAAGGTLFLDEIGEIGPDVQPKLLRFLESGEIHPLGEPRPSRVDVRVIASTNANLERLVAEGRFREDLFYRLNVIRLQLPPLRERREEIPAFVDHFLRLYSEELHKGHLRVADETMEYLLLYKWPGNVRELANEVRRLVAMTEPGAVLMPEHLRSEVTAGRLTIPATERPLAPTEVVVRLDQPLAAAFEHVERAAIAHALKASGGGLDQAARMLDISRKGLYLKRQRLGRNDAPSS